MATDESARPAGPDEQRSSGDGETTGTAEATGSDGRSPLATWGLRALGLGLAVGCWVLLGAADTLAPEARLVAAVGVLMATWWVSEAIPLSATALIPIVAFPVLGVRTIGEATESYADPIVFLFLGGFLIAIAMQKWSLHRRIALLTLRAVGTTPSRIVLGIMIATAFLSLWVSNTATALMMLPIALSVLTLISEGRTGETITPGTPLSEAVSDPAVRSFGVGLVLSVAWAATIGGVASLISTPPNAIVAAYLNNELDLGITFFGWMQLGLPIAVVFLFLTWLLITRVLFRTTLTEIPGGREMIDGQLRDMGPMSPAEKRVLVVFAGAALLWMVPGLLAEFDAVLAAAPWLDDFEDSVIAIGAGIVLFLLPAGTDPPSDATEARRHPMLLSWDDAQKGLPWGVLVLFGGGLSLAGAVSATDLDVFIGQSVEGLGALPTIALVFVVVAIVLALTELTSNTATAATFIPVLGGVALGIGVDATTLLVPAALAATCAFMLPVGTPPNAVVFSTGLVRIGQMARGGLALNVVGVLLITGMAYLIGGWALGLQF